MQLKFSVVSLVYIQHNHRGKISHNSKIRILVINFKKMSLRIYNELVVAFGKQNLLCAGSTFSNIKVGMYLINMFELLL